LRHGLREGLWKEIGALRLEGSEIWQSLVRVESRHVLAWHVDRVALNLLLLLMHHVVLSDLLLLGPLWFQLVHVLEGLGAKDP